MGLRGMRQGDYSGRALYTAAGHWVVTVSRYLGWNNETGYQWQNVPAEDFFRLDVLGQQLQAAGIQVKASFREGRCLLTPPNPRGRVGPDGTRIKRFMAQNYGSFGPERRRVVWSWEIQQYD